MFKRSLFIISALILFLFSTNSFAENIKPASLAKNYPDKKKLSKPAKKQGQQANKAPASLKVQNPASAKKAGAKAASHTTGKTKQVVENKQAKSVNKSFPQIKKTAPKNIKKPVIIIDAGHGGKDPGAIGKAGTYEKNITLNYALTLAEKLQASGKYKVVLTRSKDIFLPLETRVQKARSAKADIFISLHADSTNNPMTRGFSVYTLSNNRAERVANKLLRNANHSDEVVGIKMKGDKKDVQACLIDMAQTDSLNNSERFSSTVAQHLKQKVKPLEKTRREASLQVLTAAEIPSILIELGYLSNSMEEKLLPTKDHKEKIVNGIKAAIDEYFQK